MRRIIVSLIIVLLAYFIFLPYFILAQQGCCSWHQGISYCDSLSGYYMCNDGTRSPTCRCGGSTYYVPPPPTIPICPIFSTYNYSNQRCECMYGYVASGNICISEDQACKDQYGYNSQTNYSGACVCRSGYIWNVARTSCISVQQYCWDNFGYSSTYDYINQNCKCLSGYKFDGSRCIIDIDPNLIPQVKGTYIAPTSVPPTHIPTIHPTKTPYPTFTTTPIPTISLIPTSEPTITTNPIQLEEKGDNIKSKFDHWLVNIIKTVNKIFSKI